MIAKDEDAYVGRATLLFHNYAFSVNERRTNWHQHGHWQLEIARKGPFVAASEYGEQTMDSGDFFMIPPLQNHDFRYPAREVTWLTVRFECPLPYPDAVPQLLRETPVLRSYHELLSGLLPTHSASLNDAERLACEHALAGLVAFCYAANEPSQHGQTSSFLRKVENYVERNADRPVTVPEVAKHVGYSGSHVSAEYKRLTGGPLKHAIDRARAGNAQQLLLYSDYNVSEIAERLEFSDVYAFSRFVKRLLGKSPRALRKEG